MFKIKTIETDKIYTVYGCQELRGITYFLIYENTYWKWKEASLFIPYEDFSIPSYIPIYIPSQPQPYDPMKPYITWTSDTKPTE